MQRAILLSLCTIAGVALAWLLWRPGDPGDTALGQSAGTLRPRLAPTASRRDSGAEAQGVAASPAYRRAPEPSPGPRPSGTVAAREGSASSTGEASYLASVAPSSGQAGAGNTPANPRGPSGLPVFARVAAPAAPAAPSAPEGRAAMPAPQRSAVVPGRSAPAEAAPPIRETVTADSLLTPGQIAAKVDEALQGVPSEQREAVEPVVTKAITTNANQAAGWVGASPPTDSPPAPAP